ncbi:hypothetical protein Pst134EA_023186 [Puccinia striiformis f. sp. tritici]|uniref:uncharacterized protein n=1 Tax=Puccinia striiformis f. sp. tritici TaxID=168172 RepID=UPI00200793A7|nr:uncharacterized protein Pst134EA_032128 [Puccinia striiformis f. sp. tritici]XP_047801937.1 hypothetical protein Pst134EA_023186 [Puccinia striiformis f. sp. tritici]KAH9441868.1 hypothetical protein Pst134EA_032128 [Puccinia striiformis f. sp. tritici]KAH9455735.1 hypothetical protein Pst134EA_023186 [Puccinia striiformis f. sp. tritici]
MDMALIWWIGIIWIVSSSFSRAAPMTRNRRALRGLSEAKSAFQVPVEPLATSHAPVITTKASESYSATRSVTLEGPAFSKEADPILSAGTSKPLPKVGLSGRFRDLLDRKKSSSSIWQKIKTTKSKSLTILRSFKTRLRRLRDSSLRRFSPATRNPFPPPESMKGVEGEAKIITGTEDLTPNIEQENNLTSEKEKNLGLKTETADVPPSSWWDLINVPTNGFYSFVDTVKSRLPQSLQYSSPAPEPNIAAKVIKPSTDNALEVATQTHGLPMTQSGDQPKNLASANEKNFVRQGEQSDAPRLSWYHNAIGFPRNAYRSLVDKVKPPSPHGHMPDPSASKAASTASELASHSQQIKQKSSVVKNGDPVKQTEPDKEPALTSEVKEQLARVQLTGLVNEIVNPMVSKYLTLEKTGRMVDRWLNKKNVAVRWTARWVPHKYYHNFIREKIAPTFVRGFASLISKLILKYSPENVFEILERNSVEFMATVNKAHADHPSPKP